MLRLSWVVSTLGLLSPFGLCAEENRIDFNRDIRPILSDTCYKCHGPDENKRKADLRLDQKAGLFANRGDSHVVVPGQLERSELFRRITSDNPRRRMPPKSEKRQLSHEQIQLIRRWIAQGAGWQQHWAFVSPQRPPLPAFNGTADTVNPIDAFVRARLAKEGLQPAPRADRYTLIRRVTLDLTGLPPTPAEVDAFVEDREPNAYARLVDRLLASPRFGERIATRWLDAARYADTSGYQSDGPRYMWRWRDWVIDAYNANVPFDRFTVEQLAGDLLPEPTLEQRIATGFNRNHRGNAEGGIIAEEYQVEYVVDRVETTATVWLGLTLGCARCHDHKYDPFSQKEFYSLFAYFNNVPEHGRALKIGNSPPYIKAPTRSQQERLRQFDIELDRSKHHARRLQPRLRKEQAKWEAKKPKVEAWTIERGLVAHFALDKPTDTTQDHTFAAGKLNGALHLDGKQPVEMGDVGKFGFFDKFSGSAWIYPNEADGVVLSRAIDTDRASGYSFQLHEGKLQVNLVKRWLDDAIRVQTVGTIPLEHWQHVAFTYDGSRVADGIRVYIDGKPAKLEVLLDELNQTFATDEPFRIGSGGGSDNRFVGMIDDVRVYATPLTPNEIELLATPESIREILALSDKERNPAQKRKLARYYLERHAPKELRNVFTNYEQLVRERDAYLESVPTCMVMEELAEPRTTHVLLRGQYNQPGQRVQPDVPAVFPSLNSGKKNNRLALARWLVHRDNPLTARVQVNRYWQMLFGSGIVRTLEDFGSQGDPPSHPELLDWLAVEFMDSGYDVKHMLRLMVSSATYRQASRLTPELLQSDPENRLLARGPRFRLTAEMIRDQALAVSGLLVERLGGPSVKPYQPSGLWVELTSGTSYEPDTGEKLYRRSMYTFWKRTVGPPMMINFDGTPREMCVLRRSRTNTPLQALNLLNDVTFLETARHLAQRVLHEAVAPRDRIILAFRLATGRPPTERERRILTASIARHLRRYRDDEESARHLVQVGDSAVDDTLDVSELAAYTILASTFLNLDEVVTRE